MQFWYLSHMHKSCPINMYAQLTTGARGLIYLSLHPLSYFAYTSSKGSAKTTLMHRLNSAFANRIFNMYQAFVE